jgi:hypothetical protein
MPSKDRRSDILDREIIELFNKGLNYRQIATYFKTDSKIIIKRLSRNGISATILPKERRLDLDNNVILESYNQGNSPEKIAKLLKTNCVTIRNRLKQQGIILIPSKRDDVKTEELIKLYVEDKLSTTKIAYKFNTTAQMVKTRLKQAGISRRSKKEAGDLIARRNTCVICGVVFRPKLKWTDTTSTTRKTCGDICYSILLSQIQSGDKGSNWKDGSSQTHYQKISRKEHPQICEICQKEEIRIDTHHNDRDHCNNSKENIHPWCVICHAKYHYITDNRGLRGWNPNTPVLIEFKKRLEELGISYT